MRTGKASRKGTCATLTLLALLMIPVSALIASGADVKREKAAESPGTLPAEVTYSEHIAPILYNRCASCHHQGEVAPFPLMSYDDASKRAETINAVVTAKYMPPWKPAAGFGDFQASRALTEHELKLIQKWVAEGAPKGDQSKCPSPPNFSSQWRLGKPDLVLTMPSSYTVPASGPDIYRCFVIPTGVLKDKYVSAVEFKPGNRRVVHHAIFFLDNTGVARKKDAQDKAPGFVSFGGPGFMPTGGLGGWAPGNSQQPLPDGVARVIRGGADLVIQEHFHPTGKVEEEQSTIGIYFSKKTPERLLMPLVVRSRGIDIPAGESEHKVSASFELPIDMKVVNVTPHAHLLCKSIKAEAHTPDGRTIPLIWIRNWDFNWQEQYTYESAMKLPRGTRIDAEFVYDNTEANPRNPNRPPKRVRWGEQTTDEMAILFFGAIAEKQEEVPTYVRALLRRNAPLLLQGGAGQWLNIAKQILKPDKRFGKIIPSSDEGPAGPRGASSVQLPSLPSPAQTSESPSSSQSKIVSASNVHSAKGTAVSSVVSIETIKGLKLTIPDKDKIATVLIFSGTECPISNRYSPVINDLVSAYASRSVRFVGIYCDPSETHASISEHAAKYGYQFDLAKDKSRELQKVAGVSVTPEVAVFDSHGKLVYRGRIDNRYVTFGTMRDKPSENDLHDVLESLEKGLQIKPRFTKAVGCSLPRS